MAQLKKFLFDNFIIETKPEADVPADDSEELLCAAEELNVETEAQPEPQEPEFEEKIVEYEPVEEEPAEKAIFKAKLMKCSMPPVRRAMNRNAQLPTRA